MLSLFGFILALSASVGIQARAQALLDRVRLKIAALFPHYDARLIDDHLASPRPEIGLYLVFPLINCAGSCIYYLIVYIIRGLPLIKGCPVFRCFGSPGQVMLGCMPEVILDFVIQVRIAGWVQFGHIIEHINSPPLVLLPLALVHIST